MSRREASARKMRTHRARPVMESLEGRQLLSGGGAHGVAASPSGVLSANGRVLHYLTPSGGHATVKVVGVGSLAGTSIDSSGALHLVYGGTNAYSKIVGKVNGGSGHATLASILNLQLIASGQPDSLSGVGGTPLASVLMHSFDLEAGGTIILTPGVTSVVLNSIGPNTNVQLRTLPPAPSYRILPPSAGNTAGGDSALYGVEPTTSSSSTSGTSSTSTSFSSTQSSTTLEAGQSASISSAQGVTTTYASDGGRQQVLTNVSGDFTAQTNLLETLAPGQAATEPPAPPGIILKAKSIGGTATNINPLTDSKIFGYDPTTGQLVRFDLNLKSDTGSPDPTFAPISVPGDPTFAGVGLAQDGTQLVVLVGSSTTVYAYNANTGAAVGSFTSTVPVTSIASSDAVTVLGSSQTNQLQAINLPASLQAGSVQPLNSTMPYTPPSEVTLLGGLTGVAGSTNLYAAIGAHLSTLQPNQLQLGIQSVGTVQVAATSSGTVVSNALASGSRTALTAFGNNITVQTNPIPAGQIGEAMGSVDQSLALDTGVFNGANILKLYGPNTLSSRGSISLAYSDQLGALSQSFRTDLGGAALIDIQGDVQSIRGGTANGMFLNDTGNLATIKLQRVENSTIVGQPISHIKVPNRTNTAFLTSIREVGNRNGASTVQNIQPIGPTTLEGDS